jgi:hypothetical protein
LVGTDRDLSHFEENSKDEPDIELLVVSKEQSMSLANAKAAKIKEKWMREAWHPEYFSALPKK